MGVASFDEAKFPVDHPECAWITRELAKQAQGYAISHVVPEHLQEVRGHAAPRRRAVRGFSGRSEGCP